MNLSIVFLISNIRGWTEAFLDSLRNQNLENHEIIAVFNGTNKLLAEKIKKEYSDIFSTVIEHDKNIGVPKAYNDAIKKSSNDWILFLHNDVVMPTNFIDDFIRSSNEIIGIDETVVGFVPSTNYSVEGSLIKDLDIYNKYLSYKPSNKSIVTKQEINEIIEKTYYDEELGYYDLDSYYSCNKDEAFCFSYLPEISHFCLLLKKEIFNIVGLFDEDYFPITYFEKSFFEEVMKNGYCFVNIKNSFIHHNGNTTSDFFGFNYDEILKKNKELFDNKMNNRIELIASEKYDKFFNNKENSVKDETKRIIFIWLAGDEGDQLILKDIEEYAVKNPNFEITILCNRKNVHKFIDNNVFDNVIPCDLLVSSSSKEEDLKDILSYNNEIKSNYDAFIDYTLRIYSGEFD